MFSLAINNPTIEEFYYEECKKDDKAFVETISHLLQLRKIKNELKTAFKEVQGIQNGKIEPSDLDKLLDTLDSDV